MGESKQDRIEIINKLIVFISNRGRRFFYTEGTLYDKEESVAYVKLNNGRIYFVDNYTLQEVAVINSGRGWDGFSHGGTLKALVLDFAEFIRTGKDSNGNNGYGGLHFGGWGHGDLVQKEIVDYAKEIGYLRG